MDAFVPIKPSVETDPCEADQLALSGAEIVAILRQHHAQTPLPLHKRVESDLSQAVPHVIVALRKPNHNLLSVFIDEMKITSHGVVFLGWGE